MKKDLLTFLMSSEAPADDLNLVVKKDIQLSFRKKEIILKFIGYQILGAIFSLSFCPQFGVGLNTIYNISHYFMQFGLWACAAFCGSLFLTSGIVVAFLGMKGEEVWWMWRRYKFQAVLIPTLFWGVLMIISPEKETLYFNLWWIASAIVTAVIMYSVRSFAFRNFQSLKV